MLISVPNSDRFRIVASREIDNLLVRWANARLPFNRYGQLNLPVDLASILRYDKRVIGSHQRRGRFEENYWFVGDIHLALGGMVTKIKSDANNLAGAANRRPQALVRRKAAPCRARPDRTARRLSCS